MSERKLTLRDYLWNFKEAVVEREKATKAAERTLKHLEAATAAHDEAVAQLDATESTFEAVQGHVVRCLGGRAPDRITGEMI